MPKTLSVSIPHKLTEAEARARIVKGVADARQKYPTYLNGATDSWTGNTMSVSASVLGQSVTGRVTVLADKVNIEVDLPMLLGMLANKIMPELETRGRKLLEKSKG